MSLNAVDAVAMLAVIQYLTFSGLVGKARGLGFLLSIGPVYALAIAALVPAVLGNPGL